MKRPARRGTRPTMSKYDIMCRIRLANVIDGSDLSRVESDELFLCENQGGNGCRGIIKILSINARPANMISIQKTYRQSRSKQLARNMQNPQFADTH